MKLKDTVVIKSFPNGISLHMDSEAAFEDILQELGFKFSQAKKFFKEASMALSIEGRELSASEEIQVLETMRDFGGVNVVCIVGRDDDTNKKFIKALQHMEKKLAGDDDGQFYKGALKNKEVLETENSIVILGDVYPGSAVISAKNIIILGGLYGEAYAGGNGQDGAYIVALEMEPERLKVGDFKYKTGTKQSKWGIRPKVQPKIAYVKNGKIVMDPLTKDLLGSF